MRVCLFLGIVFSLVLSEAFPAFAQPLSLEPADAEIFEAKILPEPLVAISNGGDSSGNAELAAMLNGFESRTKSDDFSALEKFLNDYPDSRWRAAVLTNLGLLQYRAGYFSRSIPTFLAAWEAGKDAQDRPGKGLADRAAGEYVKMLARLGRYPELKSFLKSVENRQFSGQATELIAAGKGGAALMEEHPDMAFRCGPLALSRILWAQNSPLRVAPAIMEAKSTMKGMSLTEVAAISRQVGLNYQPAKRSAGAPFIFPSVIHWKAGHYAALLKEDGGRFHTDDPTFENETWHSREALEAEASGYFLVPPGPLPAGWIACEEAEAAQVYGKGATGGNNSDGSGDGDQTNGGPENGGSCPPKGNGMATYTFHSMLVSLRIVDTPVGYNPPYGSSMDFRVAYSQREASQPANFNYSNFGQKWNFNWLSYIVDDPAIPGVASFAPGGGGTLRFSGYASATQSFAPQYERQSTLKRVATNPLRYELTNPDGSMEVFGQLDGGTVAPRKVFLTKRIDPAGNAVTLSYDKQLRITKITDALGQASVFTYGLKDDPYKITRITDPFGRKAEFSYENGRLIKIKDVIGLESEFTYQGSTDFIDALKTPYGTTRFSFMESGRTRRITATNPLGDTEVLEYNENTNLQASSDPSHLLPVGVATRNSILWARNSYFWDRKAWREYPNDYTKARLYHWLHTANYAQADNRLESVKMPFENRIWFNYPGQPAGNEGATVPGIIDKPNKIGRRLNDGRTELSQFTYNDNGLPLTQTDEVGRKTVYTYEANGIDLKSVEQQTAGGLVELSSFTWNKQHRPLTYTDAAGKVTSYKWNAQGQLVAITNAKKETTAFTYYTANATNKQRKGRLQKVDGALAGTTDVVTFDYDATGNPASVVGPDKYTLVFTYDVFDRLTRVTFPDATYTETTYSRLDPVSWRDRLGRTTTYAYNSVRQLESVTDPLNRTIGYVWCKCGELAQLIDAMGRITRWKHNAQGQLTGKVYADGSTITYSYRSDNGLLHSITDEKGQVKTRTYNLDRTLAGIAYTNEEHETPDVSFTYDTEFRRLKTMLDGIGTTTYAYLPIVEGTLGAGRLASVDGPLPDDTLTYSYDEVGRNIGYAINGVGEARTFDPLGRVLTTVNPLGTFGYTYVGATGRMNKVTYPNGMTCQYNYHPLIGNFRLKDIIHTLPGNTQLSRHSYEYNAVGDITRWTQISPQAGLNRSWLCGYDAAGQLTSVVSQHPETLAVLPTGQYGYTYDPAGNRLTETVDGFTSTASFNALNQLTSVATGGVTTLPEQTYEWDAEDRLVAINYIGTTERTEFRYDGFSRRREIREKNANAIVDHQSFVLSTVAPLEERDTSAATIRRRWFPRGIQLLESGNLSGKMITRDSLWSPRESVSQGGIVTSAIDIDPWGRRSLKSGAVEETNLSISGHWFHVKSKLAMAPFRSYAPTLGRWISRDPLMEESDINLYRYVNSDPIGRIDPLGLYDLNGLRDAYSGGVRQVPSKASDYNVYFHSDGKYLYDGSANGNRYTAQDLFDIIQFDPNFWKANNVKIWACNAGRDPNSLADDLAQIFRQNGINKAIEAPSGYVSFDAGYIGTLGWTSESEFNRYGPAKWRQF